MRRPVAAEMAFVTAGATAGGAASRPPRAPPRRRKNGIRDRGGHSACSRFAQAARINRARHYMGLDWWRFIDAQRRIRVKVALLDSAVLDRYRAAPRSRESEDRSAL